MSGDDALADFSGVARLFPLPNLVLFPWVMQPLHIFEPRYRQMTRDALADDRLLAIVLLQPGWEPDYEGRPPIHTTACLGRIVAEQSLDDGRFNLMLRGLARVEIVEELPSDRLYRSARVELIDEVLPGSAYLQQGLRRQLQQLAAVWFGDQPAVLEQFERLFHDATPLHALVDLLSFALPLAGEVKQELLREPEVTRRVQMLVQLARKTSTDGGKPFPPEFSAN